jgi:hypothetical protein
MDGDFTVDRLERVCAVDDAFRQHFVDDDDVAVTPGDRQSGSLLGGTWSSRVTIRGAPPGRADGEGMTSVIVARCPRTERNHPVKTTADEQGVRDHFPSAIDPMRDFSVETKHAETMQTHTLGLAKLADERFLVKFEE